MQQLADDSGGCVSQRARLSCNTKKKLEKKQPFRKRRNSPPNEGPSEVYRLPCIISITSYTSPSPTIRTFFRTFSFLGVAFGHERRSTSYHKRNRIYVTAKSFSHASSSLNSMTKFDETSNLSSSPTRLVIISL